MLNYVFETLIKKGLFEDTGKLYTLKNNQYKIYKARDEDAKNELKKILLKSGMTINYKPGYKVYIIIYKGNTLGCYY